MKTMTPMKAIRLKCVDCCCHQLKEIRLCRIKDCSLWPYRMGHRPIETTDASDAAPKENRMPSKEFQHDEAL